MKGIRFKAIDVVSEYLDTSATSLHAVLLLFNQRRG